MGTDEEGTLTPVKSFRRKFREPRRPSTDTANVTVCVSSKMYEELLQNFSNGAIHERIKQACRPRRIRECLGSRPNPDHHFGQHESLRGLQPDRDRQALSGHFNATRLYRAVLRVCADRVPALVPAQWALGV